jgi:putative phosphoesterase
MRLGFVSDAHGNSDGLGISLKFLRKQCVDEIYFLGDAIGYMPDWYGVFSLLEEFNVLCIQGNHERMSYIALANAPQNLVYKISPDLLKANEHCLLRAASWPTSMNLQVQRKKLLLVHGSPSAPSDGYVYMDTPLEAFATVDADAIFMGHTHRPFVKRAYGKLLVNVGSCGLPRDVGNLASCAIYDVEKDNCEIFRLPFDVNNLLTQFKGEIHSSVESCLLRQSDSYFGTLID